MAGIAYLLLMLLIGGIIAGVGWLITLIGAMIGATLLAVMVIVLISFGAWLLIKNLWLKCKRWKQ